MSRMNIILNALLAFMVYTTGFLIANRFSEIGEVSFQSYQNNLFIPISKINLFSIILNNLIVIINLILGGFVFGVPTLLNIFSNGYMFGCKLYFKKIYKNSLVVLIIDLAIILCLALWILLKILGG